METTFRQQVFVAITGVRDTISWYNLSTDPAEVKVFNLFSGLVRQEGLSRIERAQQRQSLVPDLRIAIQPQAVADEEVARDLRMRGGGAVRGGGGTVEGGVLHEVKIISCNKTRYNPNSPKRAVDARADLLPQEYLNKARAAEVQQH